MATNIEQIFRSFVVNKFREIQEEQQHGKVEGQPNGDTIPAEQANPSDDTVAGAGSRQNDQIVQKIEEVLSGALDTELLLLLEKQRSCSLKCKKIAQSTDDVIVNKPHVSDEEEEERPFYNHPFKLNEPKPIFFNLSVTPPPQPKNQVSLSKEFPVSSGSQHRKKEADSVYGEWVPVEKGKEDSKDDVFPKPSIEGVDITAAMNDRALAQKRLNENTFDLEAMCMLNRAQEQIDAWAQSNSIPGQFTGSTGAQILSSDELTNSGPQAWIRKVEVMQIYLSEYHVLNVRITYTNIVFCPGLVAVGEKAQKRSGHYVVMKDLSGKHPVSALMEICNKRRWSPPEFVLVDDSGPDHRKHFIFKVSLHSFVYCWLIC
uniref:DRBM domain-containing protein n=1 Tax=Pavo cristatus TaxID=9049 RepID=A0A8C9EH93_PAVCR